MKVVRGTFKGTGAALYLGLGFVPDQIEVQNLSSATLECLRWDRDMARGASTLQGVRDSAVGLGGSNAIPNVEALATLGIEEYWGGDELAAASTSHLVRDPEWDKRAAGTGNVINMWTLGSVGNKTGNVNAELNTTYVGVGSEIDIQNPYCHAPVRYRITALTSNGEQANEITLNAAAPSGVITRLGPIYDWTGAAAGVVMPKGVVINEISDVNVAGELCRFAAYLFED